MTALNLSQMLRRLFQRPLHFRTEALSSYLDGRLLERERARLEAHLAACPACRGELEELRSVVGALRRLPEAPLPRSFRLSPSQVEAVPVAPARPRLTRALPAVAAAALVAFAVLVGGDLLVLQGRQEEAPRGGAPAMIEQAEKAAQDYGLAPEEAAPRAPEATPAPGTPPAGATPEAEAPGPTPPAAMAAAPSPPTPPGEVEEARPAGEEEEEGIDVGRVAVRAAEAAAGAIALAALAGWLLLRSRRVRP